jgi:hypothetical protein
MRVGAAVFIGCTAQIGTEVLRVDGGDAYFDHNVSFLSFTDRTPHFIGDALAEIMKIQSKDGEIDHVNLPAFLKTPMTRNIYEERLFTKTRQLTTKVIKQEPVSEITLIDGKYVRIVTTKPLEIDEPVFEEHDLYDSEGRQLFYAAVDKEGRVIPEEKGAPVKHRIPVMETYEEMEQVKIGEEIVFERNVGNNITLLNVAVQELATKLEKLEGK